MLASLLKTDSMNTVDKQKFVVKNEHSKAQMQAMEKRFVEYEGPYLTLQQALERAKAQQNQPPAMKKQPKRIAVIKNGMTDQKMDESGEAWANHQGLYMTLAEVLAIEKAKQEKVSGQQDSSEQCA